MRRLSVLHLTREFPDAVTGGIEQSIAIAAASQPNVSHMVLCLGVGGQAMRSHVNRVRIWRVRPFGSFKYLPISLRWFLLFKRLVLKVDIVHVHSPFPLGELTCLMTTLPVVSTYHADVDGRRMLGKLYRPFQRWWLNRMKQVIATSQQYQESSPVLSELDLPCQVIPFGLPPQDIEPDRPPEDLPPKYFLFLGSLRWYKGIDILVRAAKETGCSVVIAGDGEQRSLVETVREPVYWIGQVSDHQRAWLLQHAVAIILPSISRAEAFGFVLLEGMRVGKPLICTRLGTATDWLVIDGFNGLVIEPNESEELGQAMTTLWQSDALVAEMGLNAKTRFEENFSSGDYGAALQKIYESEAQ